MYGNDDARMHGAVLQIITAVKSRPSAMSNTADAPHHPPSAAMELMSGYDACTERMLHDDDEVKHFRQCRLPAGANSSSHIIFWPRSTRRGGWRASSRGTCAERHHLDLLAAGDVPSTQLSSFVPSKNSHYTKYVKHETIFHNESNDFLGQAHA